MAITSYSEFCEPQSQCNFKRKGDEPSGSFPGFLNRGVF